MPCQRTRLEGMDAAALALLLQPEGFALLNSLPDYDDDAPLKTATALRAAGHSPELVAAVLTQSRLRTRAQEKFGEFAAGMLFTPAGLEQATRLEVAALHAQRFLNAGITELSDLTAGIGADALAMSSLGLAVTAYDLDETTAAVATVNLRMFPGSKVLHANSLETPLPANPKHGVWADPARRDERGKRRHQAADYQPTLEQIVAHAGPDRALGIKVGPGIAHQDIPAGAAAQWLSYHGALLEAALWFGPLAAGSTDRTALLLSKHGKYLITASTPDPAPRAVGQFFYEPDPAVVRAGAVGTLAEDLDAGLLQPGISYLTSDTENHSPFARTYRVLDEFPFDVKHLKKYLRARDVGTITIKKRGTDVLPEKLRGQLALKGTKPATIVLCPVGKSQRVFVVEPISSAI